MNFQPRVVLVTGGAGFIGSNFIHYLFNRYSDIHIVNLDALTYAGNLDNLIDINSNYKFIRGDICDHTLIESILINYEIDTIVHFAAESHVDRSIDNSEKFVVTNVLGTQVLLQSALQYWRKKFNLSEKFCRFHYISTDEVYGSLEENGTPFTEQDKYYPNSPYSASKAGADHLVRAYYKTYSLPVTITNCSNNYGPFQHREKFIPTIIHACLNNKPIPVYGDGSNIRDWLYVVDHCQAVDLVIRQGLIGEIYNIGGNCQLSNLLLVSKICEIFDENFPNNSPHSDLIRYVPDRLGHDWRYHIDFDKIEHNLNWQPSTSLDRGLQQTINWYINNSKFNSTMITV